MAHTKGPWRVGFDDGSGPEYVRSESADKSIAKVRWGCSCCEDLSALTAEEKANLRLIAAAPQLLDTLKDMVALYRASPGCDPNHIQKALSVIRRAEIIPLAKRRAK